MFDLGTRTLLNDVHVAVRRVVFAEHVHRADDLTPGVSLGTRIMRLLLVRRRVGAGAHHGDQDLAARAAGTRDVVLLAVDDPLVAFQHRRGGHVLGVGRGVVQLGHRVGRADLAVQQRLEPLLLLLGRAHALEHLHVAGVGGRAVHALAGQRVLAQLGGDVGVVEVRQAFAGFGVRQEEVPQALLLGLFLGAVEQLQLARRVGPAVGTGGLRPASSYFTLIGLTVSTMKRLTCSYSGMALADMRRSFRSSFWGHEGLAPAFFIQTVSGI
jgi:hypothetical protein